MFTSTAKGRRPKGRGLCQQPVDESCRAKADQPAFNRRRIRPMALAQPPNTSTDDGNGTAGNADEMMTLSTRLVPPVPTVPGGVESAVVVLISRITISGRSFSELGKLKEYP
jgi:hypothetical protein